MESLKYLLLMATIASFMRTRSSRDRIEGRTNMLHIIRVVFVDLETHCVDVIPSTGVIKGSRLRLSLCRISGPTRFELKFCWRVG